MMKIMMKYNLIKEIIKEAPNGTQHSNNAHPKKSLIDCVGVQLDNAQYPQTSRCAMLVEQLIISGQQT